MEQYDDRGTKASICIRHAIKPAVAMTNNKKYRKPNRPEILADNLSNETMTLSKDAIGIEVISCIEECLGEAKVTLFSLAPFLN